MHTLKCRTGIGFLGDEDALIKAWNKLKNRALGRGTGAPNVPPKLAAEVLREYKRYRAARHSAYPSMTYKHVRRYRKVLAKVEAAGVKLKAGEKLEPTNVEELGEGIDAAARFAKNTAIVLGVMGATGLVYMITKD